MMTRKRKKKHIHNRHSILLFLNLFIYQDSSVSKYAYEYHDENGTKEYRSLTATAGGGC